MVDPSDRFSDARCLDRTGQRSEPDVWSATSDRGVVSTAHYRATAAGVEVLEAGGNAIDAAVAASLALAVCESAGSGIGGMCMMTVHLAATGRTFTIEGPCRAPALATPAAVSAGHRYQGHGAVAVPTMVATLDHALSRYGTMGRVDVLGSAIHLAESGYAVTEKQHQLMVQHRSKLRERGAGRFFLGSDGEALAVGASFRQPVLAATLRRLAQYGFDDFYAGEIAREIDADMRRSAGFVRMQDLAAAREVRESEPIRVPYAGGTACILGPPGGGLALAQLLQMLEAHQGELPDPDSPAGAVWIASLIRRARLDRQRHRLTVGAQDLGGASELCDPAYAARALAEVEASGRGETSHLSVMDREGNAVGVTQSVERSFGAAVATESLGFVYNGYLRAFKVENRRHPHYLRPGAVARSNAAPTIVLKDGVPWIVIGSTGSERMVSGIFQVQLRLCRQSPFASVLAPRLHATPDGAVMIEADRVPEASLAALEAGGFRIQPVEAYAFAMGGLHLAMRQPDGGFLGVAEPRRDGAAGGPSDGPQT